MTDSDSIFDSIIFSLKYIQKAHFNASEEIYNLLLESDDLPREEIVNILEKWYERSETDAIEDLEMINEITDITYEPETTPEASTETETTSESRKYAVVTLLMNGIGYLPGSIVMARSYLEKHPNRIADLICMVTPDSESAIPELSKIYDKVIKVDYISQSVISLNSQKKKEKYADWISNSFTKFQCLKFIEYEKVLLQDSDTVFLENTDELFNLNAPAGTFSSAWSTLIHPRGIVDQFNFGLNGKNGEIISPDKIKAALTNGFVAISSAMLLKPDLTDFDNYLKMLKRLKEFGYPGCHSGFDEQSIALFYVEQKKNWSFIHQRYNFIPWKQNWLPKNEKGENEKGKILHYFNKDKPWNMKRSDYPDLEDWYIYMDILLEEDNEWENVFNKGITS